MSEVHSFRLTVGTKNPWCSEEIEFETGKTLELPCKWRFRFCNAHQDLDRRWGKKCVSLTYEVDLELVKCPVNKPSVFAAFEIVYCDHTGDVDVELGRVGGLGMEKREMKKGIRIGFLLNLDAPKSELMLTIRLKMFNTNTPSSTHINQEAIVKEALLLIQNKSKITISEENQNLLEQKDSFADFVIKVNDTGKEFPVHTGILVARSPVFRTMFNSGMKEASDGIMEIGDLCTKAVEIILKFIYCGTMSEGWADYVQELIYAGHKYEMKSLTEFCDTILVHVCSLENAFDLLKLARQFKLKTAEKEIKGWMSQNMKTEDVLNYYVFEEEEAT